MNNSSVGFRILLSRSVKKLPMRTFIQLVVAALSIALVFSNTVLAAPAAAPAGGTSAPATAAPTSEPAPPHKVVLPPGFKAVTVNGRNVLCEPADEAWVVTALGKVQATTKPATLPSTMLQKAMDQRTSLLQQLARDLALTDLTAAAGTYDKDLVGSLRSLDDYKPMVYYLVATPDRVAALMREGWTDPHFYYNKAADAVTFNPFGVLATERPQDDVLFPAAYDPKDTPEKRGEQLTLGVGTTEASIQVAIDQKARSLVGSTLAQLVVEQGTKPLDLKPDQEWFGVGIASILTAKYAAVITGESTNALMDMLTQEHPQNPLKTSAVDLLHPTDVKNMRDEALPAYYDTVRRKSARAIRFLVTKGGDQAIPKSIVTIKAKKPADGPALVKTIQEATGVDLTPQLVKGS